MNGFKKCLLIFSLFITSVSCVETTKEIDGKDYYKGDKLAVVGYLSNKGVVVNLQHTVSPLNETPKAYLVDDAMVVLKKEGDSIFSLSLISNNNIDYNTPESFIPGKNELYYIEVSAPGFNTVRSLSQKVIVMNKIERVEVKYNKANVWMEDTIYFEIFGFPRTFNYNVNFDSSVSAKSYSQFNLIFWSENSKYNSNGKELFSPGFYTQMGLGTLSETPDKWNSFFSDHIICDEKIIYHDKEWNLVKRCDAFTVQLFTFSNDFREFMINVNAYAENSMSPFSIIAKPIPSNMSNNIGYWGYVYVDEMYIDLPVDDEGSFVIERYRNP